MISKFINIKVNNHKPYEKCSRFSFEKRYIIEPHLMGNNGITIHPPSKYNLQKMSQKTERKYFYSFDKFDK